MRRSCFGALLPLFLLIFLCSIVPKVVAQGNITWNEPFNISMSRTSSIHSAIVADTYGNVHVFWSEDMGGLTINADELSGSGNTILYRCWDGRSWTEAVDILAVSNESFADFVAVAVDDMNQLHLVWSGLDHMYYSTALALEADSLWSWSSPQVFSVDSADSAYEVDIAVDAKGTVHIVYAERGNEAGVFHVTAPRDSESWPLPVRISDRLRPNELAFAEVRLAIDASGRLHAAWGTANRNGYGQAAYYARREVGTTEWDPPVLLADATSDTGFIGYPSLLPYGQDALLLIHVDENTKGRIERTSTDGGRTWSDSYKVITSMEGLNGFIIPLMDGVGNLHLAINMRPTADQRVGIYYAPRAGLDWAPIHPVDTSTESGSSAHYMDATVRLGNEIHIVWTQLDGGEIWHVKGIINNIDPIPAQTIPMVVTPINASDASTSTLIQPLLTPVGTPEIASDTWSVPSTDVVNQGTPIVMGVIPIMSLVAGIVIWELRKK